MRVDKFLKISRIVKRRPVAKEMGDNGRIVINGQVAKSSTPVEVGDEIAVHFGNRVITVRVEEIKKVANKEQATSLYSIVSEEIIENN